MRRLYLQIYLGFLVILVIFAAVTASLLYVMHDDERGRSHRGLAELLGSVLPGPERPVTELKAALERLHEQFEVTLVVQKPDGTFLAGSGKPRVVALPDNNSVGQRYGRRGWSFTLRLPDGRWLTAYRSHPRVPIWLWALGMWALAAAAGAYPLARRITRRLERLQARVEALGSGQLSSRIEVEGKDEVAELALSFNQAADRIERLVNAQRSILAMVSHELRSPLTRIRMAFELVAANDRSELRSQLAQDIAELDGLIDELLLAARLQVSDRTSLGEELDVHALAVEEGARVQSAVSGTPFAIQGDPKMLGRMLRNVFENARHHGGDSRINVLVEAIDPEWIRLLVDDGGPGIPEGERERIFEPFYRLSTGAGAAHQGVGLGLYLVREIARYHRGEARCLSRPGGGTRIEILLPRTNPLGTPAQAEPIS